MESGALLIYAHCPGFRFASSGLQPSVGMPLCPPCARRRKFIDNNSERSPDEMQWNPGRS